MLIVGLHVSVRWLPTMSTCVYVCRPSYFTPSNNMIWIWKWASQRWKVEAVSSVTDVLFPSKFMSLLHTGHEPMWIAENFLFHENLFRFTSSTVFFTETFFLLPLSVNQLHNHRNVENYEQRVMSLPLYSILLYDVIHWGMCSSQVTQICHMKSFLTSSR